MQAGTVEAMIGEPIVERRQLERQHRPTLASSLRELRAKRR